ncbi:MAG: N-acetylmuramic acid 6-phosphate etherase [Prevotellaceae bacterium]|jgi:N-acetylmuramic acid 6-phosphate etherase|nr:N-acetylmuramic acid 6-phosphate etherase [Prevotellaceae bacterium]
MQKVTEQPSHYDNLEQMNTRDLLVNINNEDKNVPLAVEKCIPEIEKLVDGIIERMHRGGRLFYIGAGTSGRLGILDASEIPPTYGAPFELIIGLIAGGDTAIRRAVEAAEDKIDGAWKDMAKYNPTADDVLVGIAASGTTPYVIGGLRDARSNGLLTASITCNPDSPVAAEAEIKIEVIVGPEFVTGSTRMKSGTAQKLVLNMISTATMVKLGKVKGNKMFDMQLSNKKLVDRGSRMIAEETGLPYEEAKQMLLEYGSVRAAVNAFIREKRKGKRERVVRKIEKIIRKNK